MVQFFYHGQNQRVLDQPAAVGNITDWLVTGGYTNVLVETANECDAGFSDYLDGGNCANEVNVIKQVQARSGGKLKVSVSWKGGEQPSDEVIAQEDIVLLHGNGINGTQLQALIASTKNSAAYKADPKPIVVNEDSTSTDNMNASVAAGVSWGYLDTGTNNYQDGFQRPPVNWTINTDAKKAFFDNALRLAGPARTKIAYSGPSGADFNDAATVGATLTDVWDNALPAMPLTFTLGSSVCAVRTNKSGQASCLLTPRGAAGSSSLSIAFEGAGIDALEQFAAASESVPFTVLKEQTTLTYEGDTTVINGSRANLSASLAEDGITPIAQRAIRLTLGSGNTAQSCQATSNAQGQAACSLIAAGQAVGSGTVSATFAGDAFYLAADSRSRVEVVTIHSGLSYTGPLSGDVDRINDAYQVLMASERAGAGPVLESLPAGLNTQLGRRFEGVELSGGQWQRLALARAGMRDPLLLLLDEPTANLDAEAEFALFETIARATRRARARGAVTILVSHRFSTVRMADVIVVVDGGKVLEVGGHDELMARHGLYAELFTLQSSAYA